MSVIQLIITKPKVRYHLPLTLSTSSSTPSKALLLFFFSFHTTQKIVREISPKYFFLPPTPFQAQNSSLTLSTITHLIPNIEYAIHHGLYARDTISDTIEFCYFFLVYSKGHMTAVISWRILPGNIIITNHLLLAAFFFPLSLLSPSPFPSILLTFFYSFFPSILIPFSSPQKGVRKQNGTK